MPLLGQGAYGVPVDYSAVGDSAWRLAAANAGAVGSLAGAVTDIGEERKKYKDDLKTGKELAKAFKTIYPEIAPAIDPYLAEMDNEETPLSQRASLGKESATLINAYMGKLRDDRSYELDQRRMDLAERGTVLDEQRGAVDVQRITNAMQQEQQAAASQAELTQYMARPLLEQALSATAQAEKRGERGLIDTNRLKSAFNKSPEQQYQIAAAALAGLPKAAPVELRNVKFTRDGQPMEGTGYFDPKTGSMQLLPVQEAWGDGSGGQSLPEGVGSDPIKAGIAEAAGRYGIPAGHALSIVAQESGFNPNTTMQSSSAKGLFQFLDADRKQYGVSENSPLTAQIDAGMRKMRDNYDAAKSALGREPTPGELYATYYQGIGAGPKILANPDASFRDTLNQFGEGHANRVIAANPWLKGISTNREFVQWSERKMNSKGFIQAGAASGPTQTPQQAENDRLRGEKLKQETEARGLEITKQEDAKATARASAQNALSLIGQLKKHPGFSSAVGVTMTPGFMPATDRKGAEAIIDQLKGQAFLTAIQQLRGLGALSDAEGQKLQQAAVRLNPDQSEADFKKALDDYERQIAEALGRLGASGGAASGPSAADRLRAMIPAQ